MTHQPLELYIDTGGTFTDCIARDSEGKYNRLKVLSNSTLRGNIEQWISRKKLVISENWYLKKDILQGFHFKLLKGEHKDIFVVKYDLNNNILTLSDDLPEKNLGQSAGFEITTNEEAPVLGARILTQTPLQKKLPQLNMKLGSTKGTNALLEKKGTKTVLFVTKGFKDLLHIGNQQRPDIFARHVIKPDPVPTAFVEVDERVDAEGNILKDFIPESLEQDIKALKKEGYFNAAVSFMNSYLNPVHEKQVRDYLFTEGFQHVTISAELSDHIKYLQRTETTAVNAYLSPVIRNYLENIKSKIGQGVLHVMTSAGGLIREDRFHPKDSLLSGPAGGVVGATRKGLLSGFNKIISFDMGGTSTDVSRFDKQYEYHFELNVGEAQIFSPAIAIETVAAGGGSICYFDGFKLCVGPESAGAYPGPACYGAGGPLCITDVNLLAGRMDVQNFGIPVFREKAEKKLNELVQQISQSTGKKREKETLINGFLQIANETMAGAIKKISVTKGYDPSQYALVGFGGAGGLHVCNIAELLGIHTILLPADAGLLSAYGIGSALIERFEEKQVLLPFKEMAADIEKWFEELDKNAKQKVAKEGIPLKMVDVRQRKIYMRFKGQESTVEIPWEKNIEKVMRAFRSKYEQIYGYWPENRVIEVESLRVIAAKKSQSLEKISTPVKTCSPVESHFLCTLIQDKKQKAPVYDRQELKAGAKIKGPAIILDKYSTCYLAPSWNLLLDANETMVLNKGEAKETPSAKIKENAIKATETELELFTNRFMFIAENMGAMLQRTSLSVNVKERLDFSCALLDADGNLVANAPHIPVHLGSLGICVKELKKTIPMEKGDVVITNHPHFGGSHLPDITLVTPVYTQEELLVGYVVNRAHHAEIGGITPASMPPKAQNLSEEGVIINPTYLVRKNQVKWDHIKAILLNGPYPTRKIDENLADLHAALAANRNGENALLQLINEHGSEKVRKYMELLKKHAAGKMKQTLQNIKNGVYIGEENLDDGTPLKVEVNIKDESCIIDFSGSGQVHPENMNATYAIVNSVVIYVLRLLIDEALPLNDGIFEPVKLEIPSGLLNPDFPDDPVQCPAIVGGNVEVSQRLTDTLLKAFGIMACSQGTMNNLMFGNKDYSYYETICGGCGAGKNFNGTSAVHHHMTNTRITDPEIMEYRYPVRLDRFEIRKGSGGKGKSSGGDGVIREITFLEKVDLSLLSQHRIQMPYGMKGGQKGQNGKQWIKRADGSIETLKGIDGVVMNKNDQLIIHTPGGGGYGKKD